MEVSLSIGNLGGVHVGFALDFRLLTPLVTEPTLWIVGPFRGWSRGYNMGFTTALMCDPCRFGLPEILTVAHISRGPKDHINLHSGSKAQDKGNSKPWSCRMLTCLCALGP